MHLKIAFWRVLSPVVILGLAGCAEFDLRKGPNPVIDGAAVQTASANKNIIIDALAEDAGYRAGEPVDYYRIAEAGFNFVDDQCRSYFDSLFFLERRREEAKSGLAASGATTAAILGITEASAPSLAIVAAAFGLASSATDIVAGTYLYRLPPATTLGFVEKLQLAYRAGAAANHALINSPTSAYYHIQRYLSLCLPPTIEAEIARQVSSASAVAVSAGGGEFFAVASVGPPVTSLPNVVVKVPPHHFIAEKPRPEPHIEPRIVKSAFVRQVQAALCVEPTSGVLGEPTRRAIQDYLRGRNKAVPDRIDPTNPVLQPLLAAAVGDVGDCLAKGFKTAYEVGGYGVPSDRTASKIKTLQKNMDEELKAKGLALTVDQTGQFDAQTRKAISELRPLLVPGTTGDYLDGSLDAQLH